MISKAMKEGTCLFEWTHRRYKGEEFPATVLLSKVRLAGKEMLIATVRDLSEEKRVVAHALSDEKMLQQAALDAIPDSFFVCDTRGKFLSWNKEFREATGYSDKEIFSLKATDFFSKVDAARVALAISAGMKKGMGKVTADVIAKDKSRLPTEFIGSVIRDRKGKVIGFAGIGRRVAGRKK